MHRDLPADSENAALPQLELFRGYLLLLARLHWNPRLAGKLDPSDVVQQTLVQAWKGLPQFRGQSEVEMRAWLRQILARQLANLARDFGRENRDVRREVSLAAPAGAIDDSSARLEAWLDDGQSSPSQRADRNEHLLRLAEALAALPEPQQAAVTLHHLHGLSVNEIAAQLERSPSAVAGLLKRGLRALREKLGSEQDGTG
jgi:RNA polymerase sigma-70 factor (ECF subfamily)